MGCDGEQDIVICEFCHSLYTHENADLFDCIHGTHMWVPSSPWPFPPPPPPLPPVSEFFEKTWSLNYVGLIMAVSAFLFVIVYTLQQYKTTRASTEVYRDEPAIPMTTIVIHPHDSKETVAVSAAVPNKI